MAQIEAACQQAAEAAQRPDETSLKKLCSEASRLSATITFNRQNPGESQEEQQRTLQLLKELEGKLNRLRADIAVQTAMAERVVIVPERAEVVALLDECASVLISAATAESDEEVRTARRIIDELTSGRIELRQMGERKKGRGWLQGRFRVDLVSLVVGKLTGTRHACPADEDFEVAIDYRAPLLIDEQADEAKRLFDQELLLKEFAVRMRRSRGYITKFLQHWFDSRELPRPNGYQRRSRLENKQTTVPVYKRLADEAVRLADLGQSNLAISRQLGVSDATVAKAIVWSYRSRGLPVPSAEERRRQTLEQAKAMIADGTLIKDVAQQVGYSARGLSLALREHDRESGDVIVDGRTRRGNATSGQSANGQRTAGDPTEAA